MRRKTVAAPAAPVYVAPVFDRHERAALAEFRKAFARDKRLKQPRASFDLLQLRQGLRAFNVASRAGWVVSNPLYDATLRARPDIDPSLPGPGWLRSVYGSRPELTVQPWTLARIQARRERSPEPFAPLAAPAPVEPQQIDLFESLTC